MRGATCSRCAGYIDKQISIHAPHAKCDIFPADKTQCDSHFNPRTSCEVRPKAPLPLTGTAYFNPRTSCEVRLRSAHILVQFRIYFNPRTSCEVRPFSLLSLPLLLHHFNPRTSCEVRPWQFLHIKSGERFQSTHLMRGATGLIRGGDTRRDIISIHAPHARCDSRPVIARRRIKHFNPRTSCEVRLPNIWERTWMRWQFQSTHLMRGATWSGCSRAGAYHFNPRTSCEVRHLVAQSDLIVLTISIHAPHARCDPPLIMLLVCRLLFQSTHLMRGATKSFFIP